MPDETLYLIFDDMPRPVELINCSHLLEHFSLVFPGWSLMQSFEPVQPPVLTLSRARDAYTLRGYWLDEPLQRFDDVDAICALVAEVMKAYVRQDDKLLCLHGAAAEFADRLIVFPAAGVRLFCDDILPVSLAGGEGVAPGLAPRLRLPLAENLSRESKDYIQRHNRLEGSRYLYLDLERDALAPRGWPLPIGAFILLERQPGAGAALEPVTEAEVLRQVVWQNFAREAEAPKILEVLGRLVRHAQRYRLRYDRAEEAAALLGERFDRWDSTVDVQRGDEAELIRASSSNVSRALRPGQFLCRQGISLVRIDDQCFLADGDGAAIHHLNSIGSAIWTLLAEPVAKEEVVELLLCAFPDLERDQVDRDVGRLLEELVDKNLLDHSPVAGSIGE